MTFIGRLGTYKYYNMDQVVGQALAMFNRIAETEQREVQHDAALSRAAREMAHVNGALRAEAVHGAGD